ncbi:MAG: response regulator transcription factor [Anaerolineales bacterium]
MSRAKNKTILVVDDEPETAQMVALLLDVHGYTTIKAHGSAKAMSAVSQGNIDAVILDVMLPDVSGLEFCRYVRRDPSLMHIPIVIVSARSREEDIRAGYDAGATEYLTKPWSKEQLLGVLQKVLG